MTIRTRGAVLFGAASLTAAVLVGCTGEDPQPGPDSSSADPSSSGSASPTGPSLVDRSEEVLGALPAATPVATTKGRSSSTFDGATFTIYGLTRSDASTLLVWSVTGGAGSNTNDANVRAWERYPVLRTKDSEYSVVTFEKNADEWAALSNPFLAMKSGVETPPQTALFPALPEGTTEVTVQSEWFEDVKVPVTEAP